MEFDVFADSVDLTRDQRDKSKKEWSGSDIYIPKISKDERDRRDEEIKHMYHELRMRTYQIHQKTGLSERQIRRILRIS